MKRIALVLSIIWLVHTNMHTVMYIFCSRHLSRQMLSIGISKTALFSVDRNLYTRFDGQRNSFRMKQSQNNRKEPWERRRCALASLKESQTPWQPQRCRRLAKDALALVVCDVAIHNEYPLLSTNNKHVQPVNIIATNDEAGETTVKRQPKYCIEFLTNLSFIQLHDFILPHCLTVSNTIYQPTKPTPLPIRGPF